MDTEDTGMVAARKEFDEKKKALADAFGRKARALSEVEDLLGERAIASTARLVVEQPLARGFVDHELCSTDCFHSFIARNDASIHNFLLAVSVRSPFFR